MKKYYVFFTVFLFCAFSFVLPALAGTSCFYFTEISKDGQIFNEYYVDLDGDGIPEKIALKSYNLKYYEKELQHYFGQLVVFKSLKNKYVQIWESPKVSYKENEALPPNKYRFFFGDVGMEPLEIIGDIDGDEKIEILSPAAQSDVRPTHYRLYKWEDNKFEYIREGYLLAQSLKSNLYEWKDKYSFSDDSFKNPWISSFYTLLRPGYLVGNIVYYEKSTILLNAEALIKYDNNSFNIVELLNNSFNIVELLNKIGNGPNRAPCPPWICSVT